jgi:hypothetical protein
MQKIINSRHRAGHVTSELSNWASFWPDRFLYFLSLISLLLFGFLCPPPPFHMTYFLLPLSLPFESDKNTCKESCFSFLGFRYFSLPRTLSSILGGMMGVYKHIFFPFSHGRSFLKLLFGDFLVCWVSFFLLLLCVLPLVCLCSWNLLCLLLTYVFVLTFCHLIFPSLSFLVCFV